MKAAFILAALSAVAANASIIRRDDATCNAAETGVSVSDCEAVMSQLMDDAKHGVVNRGPLCDKMIRNKYNYITIGACSVQTYSRGGAQCIEASKVVDAIQKIIEGCAEGEATMTGGDFPLGKGDGVKIFSKQQRD